MLKPIHRVACSPALVACQQLMQHFALWLCDPTTTGAHINQQALQPPVLASVIEADWLWEFLQCIETGKSLLSRAQTVAAMPAAQKTALRAWIQNVSSLTVQFQPAPALWPTSHPVTSASDWIAFKELFESFFKKGFKSGLPYQPNGKPTAAGGVKYADYVSAFRHSHRLNPNLDGREVCVLCGGPLGDTPQVDHWILESKFPLLSVCADNLCLICSTCNEAPNKGKKPVHSNGSFADWFHPYLRPGDSAVRLEYVLIDLSVQCSAVTPADQPKVAKLDSLLNLSTRWTREFKAEYVNLHGRLSRRVHRAKTGLNAADIESYVQEWQADLVSSEPHYEVHQTLAAALQQPSRLAAWAEELGNVNG